jgi:hypothetical protein
MKAEVCPGRETIVALDQEATGVAEFLGFTSSFPSIEVVNELVASGKGWGVRVLKFDSSQGASRAIALINKKGAVVKEALDTD